MISCAAGARDFFQAFVMSELQSSMLFDEFLQKLWKIKDFEIEKLAFFHFLRELAGHTGGRNFSPCQFRNAWHTHKPKTALCKIEKMITDGSIYWYLDFG